MHTINIQIKINKRLEKMVVAAFADVMGVDLPGRIKLIAVDTEKIFKISSYKIEGVKIEKHRGGNLSVFDMTQ